MANEDKNIDPTENVRALTEAANKRQDDLRQEAEKLFNAKIDALNKRIDDSIERFDSFRHSDREEIVKTSLSVATTADTLRKQVETTAQARDAQFTTFQTETYKRLSAVELSLSATGAGSAGEKAGRVSQQDLVKYAIFLILALITIIGAIVGVAYFVRPR